MRTARGPGAIVLFGSGETAAVGREALRWLCDGGRAPRSVAVLETPAGFEPNADVVARRWSEFLRRQPEAREAEFAQLPLRRRGTRESPDDAELARPILAADLVVLGAGSPTYAVRQLAGAVAWDYARAAHALGASVFLASASAIAAGSRALPVYEIYKVGDDPHWARGLALFETYGLELAVVTHWDNREGGAGLDTSRCFMGEARFAELLRMLPQATVVVGVDEHTALAIDPATARAEVLGRGEVTILRDGRAASFRAGSGFPLSQIGPFALPEARAIVPGDVAREMEDARARAREAAAPPPEVRELVASRERARGSADWEAADRLRREIAARGWRVEDTPEGPRLVRGSPL